MRAITPADPRSIDEAHVVGDLLKTGDLEVLLVLDRGDVIASLQHARWRSGIEPGDAATEQFHLEAPLF